MCESANSNHFQKAPSSIPGERIAFPFYNFFAMTAQDSLPVFSADFHLRAGAWRDRVEGDCRSHRNPTDNRPEQTNWPYMDSNCGVMHSLHGQLSPKFDDTIGTRFLDKRLFCLSQKRITEMSGWLAENHVAARSVTEKFAHFEREIRCRNFSVDLRRK
jgi:hypothetical protein